MRPWKSAWPFGLAVPEPGQMQGQVAEAEAGEAGGDVDSSVRMVAPLAVA